MNKTTSYDSELQGAKDLPDIFELVKTAVRRTTGLERGGLMLGMLEGLGAGYLSAQWKNVFAFVILVVLLLFKPTGLLGERVADRA